MDEEAVMDNHEEAEAIEFPTLEEVADEFEILSESSKEAEPTQASSEPVPEERKEEQGAQEESWSAKARKDRELRSREIELKKKEEALKVMDGKMAVLNDFRDRFIKKPEDVLKDLGIDPLQFFEDWTNRLATGTDEISPELRMSGNEKRVQELENKIRQMQEEESKRTEEARKQQAIADYHSKIEAFLGQTEDFPLTKDGCTPEDIAQGIAAYYRDTGKELSFREACEKIESGLKAEEERILGDERLVAKFRERYDLGAPKQGRAANTLSRSMATHPTRRDPGRHPTIEEVMAEYGDRIFV